MILDYDKRRFERGSRGLRSSGMEPGVTVDKDTNTNGIWWMQEANTGINGSPRVKEIVDPGAGATEPRDDSFKA